MRVLIVDTECLGLDFAYLCAQNDHEVKWFRQTKHPIRDGEGFPGVQVVTDWRAHIKWAKDGVIVTTMNDRYMADLDRYRDLGFCIFGPTAKSARMEIQRAALMDLLQRTGIKVSPYKTFSSLEDAQKFAWKADRCWVFKTLGSEDDKSLTYVPHDPADLVGWLNTKIKQGLKLKGPCMLQEKVDGTEIGIAGWMGKNGFLTGKWELSWEHKRLMDGDHGPNTGEQGTVALMVEHHKLADDYLWPLEEAFRKMGHLGDLNLNGAWDGTHYWVFEATVRLGWPDFYLRCAMNEGDPVTWMRDAWRGEDTLKVSRDWVVGVVLAQPPYPYDDQLTDYQVEGAPITGAEEVWDHVHPVHMMVARGPIMEGQNIIEAPQIQTTGAYVMVLTGQGSTLEKAREEVYAANDKIHFKDKMLRTDIGAHVDVGLVTA